MDKLGRPLSLFRVGFGFSLKFLAFQAGNPTWEKGVDEPLVNQQQQKQQQPQQGKPAKNEDTWRNQRVALQATKTFCN